jgi:hypothetical protein
MQRVHFTIIKSAAELDVKTLIGCAALKTSNVIKVGFPV